MDDSRGTVKLKNRYSKTVSQPKKEAEMKNKVVLFEIPASNLTKAKEFYESIFDWKVNLWEDEGAMALTTAVDKDEQPIEL
jgi:predicted enzyme related to lactoylglutathione lyase